MLLFVGWKAKTSSNLHVSSSPALPTEKEVGGSKHHKDSPELIHLPPALRPQTEAYLVMPPLPAESEQLFVLPRHEVDSGVFQQSREHEEQAHCHPNVDGFHVGHLQGADVGKQE